MKLSNHTILITGGTSGIGLQLAKKLSQRGNKIIITGRDQAKLKKAQEMLPGIQVIQSDVSKTKEIATLHERVLKDFPEMNVLINNAGIMRVININDDVGSLEDITSEVATNLCGPIQMIKQFLPHLKSRREAAIINVSSGLAFVPLPTSPVYCATKAGLHSFTLSLRLQLKNTRVKVFELAPPATATELLAGHDPEDMKGIPIMALETMVDIALKGLEKDKYEIRPGASNQLKLMNRIAPEFILKQLAKPVDRMLRSSKNQ